MNKPKVLLLSLGGTIAMTSGPKDGKGVTPTLTSTDLIAAVPGLADVADLGAETFRTIPGAHLSFDLLRELAERIETELAGDGADAVVITQGTDTLEETAFMLDLLLDRPEPVVFTGAMRNPTLPGADGPANLLAAVQVAASNATRDRGVLVVMADQVHAARFMRKAHTQSTAAFESFPGAVGWVSEGHPAFPLRATRPALDPGTQRSPARVALLTAALADDADLLAHAIDGPFEGIVIEALGAGHLPLPWADEVGRGAGRKPIVYTSRTGAGPVFTSTYAFPGSEIDLRERGAFPAGPLDGPKARILMTVLLASGLDRDQVGPAFRGYVDSMLETGPSS
ncbi:MAG: asparaginase [Thermoleophilia bacterium]|nr:asparaginase [Thermoleophilia bacterium]